MSKIIILNNRAFLHFLQQNRLFDRVTRNFYFFYLLFFEEESAQFDKLSATIIIK